MAAVSLPSTIDRTGVSLADAGAPLTAWTDTLPPGSTIALGIGARFRCDSSWLIRERLGLTVQGDDAEVFRTRRDGAGALVTVIGGRDLDLSGLRVTGSNPTMQPSAGTSRESQHCLYLSGAVDACIYGIELAYAEADLIYLGRKKIGPSGSDTSYTPCENVWVTKFYAHHAGRQIITAQGVRDCVIAGGEATEGNRAWLEMEGLVNAGNGVDGLLVRNMLVGPTRLNMIANAGSQQADNVTFESNKLARSLIVYGKDGGGRRRRGWVIRDNRLMAPADARHFPAPLPAEPPHAGSPSGCTVNLTGYDDVTITGNGPFYMDGRRTPKMVLVQLTDCKRYDVRGNNVVNIFGGDGPRRFEPMGPGVEVRADSLSTPA